MCEWFAGSAEKDHFQGLKGAAHAGADPVELSAKFALNNTLRKGASRQHSRQGLEQRSQQSNDARLWRGLECSKALFTRRRF